MNLTESYIDRLSLLAGILFENRIDKLRAQKFPEDIVNFALEFAKETSRNNSDLSINQNQYIPWIAQQAKNNPEIMTDKDKLAVITNWIKKSGYNKINSTEPFNTVYDKAKEWLRLKNINVSTGERIEGGKVVKKYPNDYQWIQATEVNWCINVGEKYGWCFNQLNRAERFVGLGDIGVNNKGYFLLNKKLEPVVALQYNSKTGIVEDIQGIHNQLISADLFPYIIDIFKTFSIITDIQGHKLTFWNSIIQPESKKFQTDLFALPNVKIPVNIKIQNGVDLKDEELKQLSPTVKLTYGYAHLLTPEEIKSLPIKDKLDNGYRLSDSEIRLLSIDDRINYGYITDEEKRELPINIKIEYDIALTQEDLNVLNQPILTKIKQIIDEEADPKDLFIKKDFKDFKESYVDDEGIHLDITQDEYDKKYSGLDEYNRYYEHYSASDKELDSEELNYMDSYLDKENIQTLKYLSEILGVEQDYNFEESENIKKFIEENLENSDDILETFLYDLSSIHGIAKEEEIEKTLKEEQKFKYKDGYLILPWKDLYEFLSKKSPISDFKELEDLEINGEINLEDIMYNYTSSLSENLIKDLNETIKSKLNKSLEDIEANPGYFNNVADFKNLIKSLNFVSGNFSFYGSIKKSGPVSVHRGNAKYKLELPKKNIFIQEVNYIERKISIFIIEYTSKEKNRVKKMLKGDIPYENLASYIQQYSLFEAKLRKEISKLLSEDFRFLYDQQTYTPSQDVVQTAQNALNIVQKNKLVQSDGSNEGSGLQKAQSLVSKQPISHAQLKRMKAFFDNNLQAVRNEKSAGKNINNSPIIQKWELWGGDAGQRWANTHINKTQSSNKTSKGVRNSDMIARDNRIMDPTNTRIHR